MLCCHEEKMRQFNERMAAVVAESTSSVSSSALGGEVTYQRTPPRNEATLGLKQ